MGGGGDVVGSLAIARRCEELGTPFALGGVAWERIVIDPKPGPRPPAEIAGGRAVGAHAVLASPETATADGVPFSEAHVARHLRVEGDADAETALIDVSSGAGAAAEGVAAAAEEMGCDLAVFVDIGGDALATGSEPGLASPLCDAIMLAAAMRLAGELEVAAVILGAGCDGELTPEEVLARVAALGRAGAWIGTWGVTATIADEVERAALTSGTEASLQVVRAARGEYGETAIRAGRRRVHLTPLGALAFCFDPVAAAPELPLARAVMDAEGIEAARAALAAAGVRTELDYERSRAGEGP
jgi:hypothetical protein